MCLQQLAEFQKWLKKFEAENVTIVAGSVDPVDEAAETVRKANITFPVAHSLDAIKISRVTGAYYDGDKKCLNSTGFLIRPDNTIDVVCYSSGPVGRLGAKEIFGLIRFYNLKKLS